MKKFDFGSVKLDDEKASILSSCIHNIDELHIGTCQFSINGIKSISTAIQLRPKPVKFIWRMFEIYSCQ